MEEGQALLQLVDKARPEGLNAVWLFVFVQFVDHHNDFALMCSASQLADEINMSLPSGSPRTTSCLFYQLADQNSAFVCMDAWTHAAAHGLARLLACLLARSLAHSLARARAQARSLACSRAHARSLVCASTRARTHARAHARTCARARAGRHARTHACTRRHDML